MLVSDLGSRSARPARSRVLRLRGLPYRALEDDILLFLAPLRVTRVHICRRNGEHVCPDAIVVVVKGNSLIADDLRRKDHRRGVCATRQQA